MPGRPAPARRCRPPRTRPAWLSVRAAGSARGARSRSRVRRPASPARWASPRPELGAAGSWRRRRRLRLRGLAGLRLGRRAASAPLPAARSRGPSASRPPRARASPPRLRPPPRASRPPPAWARGRRRLRRGAGLRAGGLARLRRAGVAAGLGLGAWTSSRWPGQAFVARGLGRARRRAPGRPPARAGRGLAGGEAGAGATPGGQNGRVVLAAAALPRPRSALRAPVAESISFLGMEGIGARPPQALGSTRRARARRRRRPARAPPRRRSARPARRRPAAGGPTRAAHQRDREVQLQLTVDGLLSPLPRSVHLGQHVSGRAGRGSWAW